MSIKSSRTTYRGWSVQAFLVVLCAFLLTPGETVTYAQQAEQQAAAPEQEAPKIPNDQLDALVAPIALYPDPLLSQVLVASTYPLEIIQLQQWLAQHKDLKDKAPGGRRTKGGLGPQHPGYGGASDFRSGSGVR
jgi:hypothetical protein